MIIVAAATKPACRQGPIVTFLIIQIGSAAQKTGMHKQQQVLD
jgi:hypothetical protein